MSLWRIPPLPNTSSSQGEVGPTKTMVGFSSATPMCMARLSEVSSTSTGSTSAANCVREFRQPPSTTARSTASRIGGLIPLPRVRPAARGRFRDVALEPFNAVDVSCECPFLKLPSAAAAGVDADDAAGMAKRGVFPAKGWNRAAVQIQPGRDRGQGQTANLIHDLLVGLAVLFFQGVINAHEPPFPGRVIGGLNFAALVRQKSKLEISLLARLWMVALNGSASRQMPTENDSFSK